jgi:hypothetical protein
VASELESGWRAHSDAPDHMASHQWGDDASAEVGRILRSHLNASSTTDAVGVPVSEVEPVARKTFVIPDGFEAVLDHNGRATGEVRPVVAAWLWQEIDGPHNLRFATTDALIADKAKSEGRRVIPLYASPTTSPQAPKGVRDDVLEEAAQIALAIDSGRGNEKEIARAIRALKGNRT